MDQSGQDSRRLKTRASSCRPARLGNLVGLRSIAMRLSVNRSTGFHRTSWIEILKIHEVCRCTEVVRRRLIENLFQQLVVEGLGEMMIEAGLRGFRAIAVAAPA